MSQTFHLVGLGCPKNKVDAEVIWAELAQAGYRAVDDPAEAELIVVNTCAFVQAAVEEALDTIVELAEYKQRGRCRTLVVAGCLPARYLDELADELSEVDLFIGPGEVGGLPERLTRSGSAARLQVQAGQGFLPDARTPRANSLSPGAAYLKVAEGCSRRCSFCIIPALRGPQRSRPLADLVAEAEGLVRWGASEIVLVAQDLAAWGRDLEGRPALPALVEALAQVAGLWWLRLMYLYPTEVTDALLRVMADNDTVLPYLDVPLQHVDAAVLTGMRRQGDPEKSLRLVERIRAALPGAALRTSLMTGFPGETPAAFERLEAFVAEARFERLGVFAFSAEEGTAAAALPDQVPAEVAAERRERLLAAQRPVAEAYHRSLIGRSVEVLVEAAEADGTLEGRCWNQAPEVDGATFLTGEAILGEVVRARVTDADAYDLEGEILA